MPVESIGLLHPGEMGAAIGAVLVRSGYRVSWASTGRREQSAQRARAAGLVDVTSVSAICEHSDLILSVCPPHAALDVAKQVAGFKGVYLDANAVAPATAREVADLVVSGGASYVDGGIIGSPPAPGRVARLYLCGARAGEVGELFSGTDVETIVVRAGDTSASALKMSYAAWTKASSALLLSALSLATAEGVDEALLGEWERSQPELQARSLRAAQQAATKGWRWTGEMEEVARTYQSAGLPEGFHRAAAELFERASRDEEAHADETTLKKVLEAFLNRPHD